MTELPDAAVTEALDAVASGHDLDAPLAAALLRRIMSGEVPQTQIAGLLIGLRTKGETADELLGFARTMRALATPVETARHDLLDTAGTGGGLSTFNVSTTAALIAAGAGCAVAKHGNRSATSLSGSADLLEALGARIDLTAAAVGRCIDEVGFGFMFAPTHHQATRFVVPVRRQLAVRTIFNLLGPLTNPAGARRQLIGVSDPAVIDLVASAVAGLDVDRVLVVCGEDGVDEVSASAPTHVVEVADGQIDRYTVTPEELGIEPIDSTAVRGGTPQQNAQTTQAILAGADGPARGLALVNAGAAIYAAGAADTVASGVRLAAAAIDSGAVASTLARFVALTIDLAPT
jgi:anthranilate phosphoribosyltransferase